MNPLTPFKYRLALMALVALFLTAAPVRADDHALIEDAHHQLELAMNPGGPAPSDADRTTELKAAMEDLRNVTPFHHGVRVRAMFDIKAALNDVSSGDPGHQAVNDIREADLLVRDMEG